MYDTAAAENSLGLTKSPRYHKTSNILNKSEVNSTQII